MTKRSDSEARQSAAKELIFGEVVVDAETRPCEQALGAKKAQGIRELIERLTGQPCPCDRGLICPLFPDIGLRQQNRQHAA